MSRWEEPATNKQRAYILRLLEGMSDIPADVHERFATAQARGVLTKRDAHDLIPLLQALCGLAPSAPLPASRPARPAPGHSRTLAADASATRPSPRRSPEPEPGPAMGPVVVGSVTLPAYDPADIWAEEYPGQAERLYPRWYLERRGYYDRPTAG